jgi:hypothetical protein
VKKDLLIAVVVVLVVAAAAFALNAMRGDKPLSASLPFGAGKAGEKASEKEGGGKAVMRINGTPITEEEFNAFAAQAPEQSRAFYASPAGRRALADELVKLKLLEQEGRKMKLDDDPEVARQIENTTAQIIAGRALEKIMAEGNDAKLRAAYAEESKAVLDLRHIVFAYQGGQLPAPEGKSAPSAAAATQKAAAVVAQIRAGAKFADLVKASDDPQTAARGGQVGMVPKAQLEQLGPEVAAAVGKLQPGQVTDPVRTPYGIHIFQANAPTFEEMRPQLVQRMQRELLEETMGKLTKAAKIDLDPQFFPPQQATPELQPVPGGAGGQGQPGQPGQPKGNG